MVQEKKKDDRQTGRRGGHVPSRLSMVWRLVWSGRLSSGNLRQWQYPQRVQRDGADMGRPIFYSGRFYLWCDAASSRWSWASLIGFEGGFVAATQLEGPCTGELAVSALAVFGSRQSCRERAARAEVHN